MLALSSLVAEAYDSNPSDNSDLSDNSDPSDTEPEEPVAEARVEKRKRNPKKRKIKEGRHWDLLHFILTCILKGKTYESSYNKLTGVRNKSIRCFSSLGLITMEYFKEVCEAGWDLPCDEQSKIIVQHLNEMLGCMGIERSVKKNKTRYKIVVMLGENVPNKYSDQQSLAQRLQPRNKLIFPPDNSSQSSMYRLLYAAFSTSPENLERKFGEEFPDEAFPEQQVKCCKRRKQVQPPKQDQPPEQDQSNARIAALEERVAALEKDKAALEERVATLEYSNVD